MMLFEISNGTISSEPSAVLAICEWIFCARCGKRPVSAKFSPSKVGNGEYPLKIIFATPKPSAVRRIAPMLCVERMLCAKTMISRVCWRAKFSAEFGFFILRF